MLIEHKEKVGPITSQKALDFALEKCWYMNTRNSVSIARDVQAWEREQENRDRIEQSFKKSEENRKLYAKEGVIGTNKAPDVPKVAKCIRCGADYWSFASRSKYCNVECSKAAKREQDSRYRRELRIRRASS